ncbi:MAG: ankyrin repeat domain-containing protein [Candidatus Margulisbacteria bacterium]|nr:ankyrin repeat domain-containing protein [Candidatus Margulisiibacteriota bacterium]
MNTKIIAGQRNIRISNFLREKLNLLDDGYNIFLTPQCERIMTELILLKRSTDLVNFFSSLTPLADLKHLANNKSVIGSSNVNKSMAGISIVNCLNNLSEQNRHIIIQKFRRDFDILGFKPMKDQLEKDLFEALIADDRDAFDEIFNLNVVDVNCRHRSHGSTPLMFAARNGNEYIVERLLAVKNINFNARNDCGNTALIGASAKGCNTVVKLLLEKKGIDINLKGDNSLCALNFALHNKRSSTSNILLDMSDIDINSTEDFLRTPLMYAVFMYSSSMVERIASFRNVNLNAESIEDYTARDLAYDKGYGTIEEILKGKGAYHGTWYYRRNRY